MARSRSKQGDSLKKQSLLNKKTEKVKRNITQKVDLCLAAINGTSLAFIYAFRQFLPKLFFGLARFILQPINAAANIIRAIISWCEAHKEGYKKRPVIRAIISTVTGIGIAIALIGGLLIGAAFALIGPCLAMASFATRSLYHIGCAIDCGITYLRTNDPKDKAKIIVNLINALATALNAIAIGLVLIAFKSSFGILGIASGAITAIFAFYQALTLPVPASTLSSAKDDTKDSSSTKRFAKDLGLKRSYSNDDLSLLKKESHNNPNKPKVSHQGLFSSQSTAATGSNLNKVPGNIARRYSC